MGFTKVFARQDERLTVRFNVRGVEAEWPEEGGQKDDWTRPVMSALEQW